MEGSLLLRVGTWEKLDLLLGLWSAPRLFWLSSELAAATSPFQLKCHLQFGWMSFYCLYGLVQAVRGWPAQVHVISPL